MDIKQISQMIGGPVDPDRARERALSRLIRACEIVSEQSEDDGLWFVAMTASEAYLQQELRRLTRAIEGGQYGPSEKGQPITD